MSQKHELRSQAHHLNPVVMIGQHGLTPAVLAEIEIALLAHELIKIKLAGDDKEARKTMTEEICSAMKAELIQAIGKVIVIYKKNPEKN